MSRVIVIFLLLVQTNVTGQPKSPFNNLVPEIDSSNNYSFLVSGHFYGGHANETGYPANTILANITWMNEQGCEFLICLGDLFLDVKNDIPQYKKSLFNPLQIPLYNAVGNHDLTDNIYQENFGETFYYFKIGNDFHVILDTELDDGDISGKQLEMLNEIGEKVQNEQINNVFVYAHRTIWKENYSELDNILHDNTQSLSPNNFESEVLPVAKKIAEKTNLFWFAGSIGSEAQVSFLYFPDKKNHITYVATAIRERPRDAMLEVIVNEGDVNFKTHSLTGQELSALEDYNVQFWEDNSQRVPFSWRLVPYLVKSMLLHRYFWYGISYTLFFTFLVKFILSRRKKQRTKPLS